MAYVLCWASEHDSDWEVINGEDAMQQRVSSLEDAGVTTIFVFDEEDELDKKEGE